MRQSSRPRTTASSFSQKPFASSQLPVQPGQAATVESICKHVELGLDVTQPPATRIERVDVRSIRSPCTAGMRQILFTEEIYFAVSEIHPLSVLVRSL